MSYKALEQMNQVLTWYPKTQWNISVNHRTDAGGELVPFVIVELTNIHTKEPVYLDGTGVRIFNPKDIVYECCAMGYETSIDDLIEELYTDITTKRNGKIK